MTDLTVSEVYAIGLPIIYGMIALEAMFSSLSNKSFYKLSRYLWYSFLLMQKKVAKKTNKIITVSQSSKNDIIDWNIDVVNEKREEKPTIYNGFHDQLEKFVSFDVEAQIIEGFVFETDRYIVKLTGAFQSLNRITGTARYQFGELFEEE